MLQDIRFAIRTLTRSPAFTIAAVLCLALGIGVNTTIFSCIRALLLRPFPYRDPGALLAIGESNPQRGWHMNVVSYPNFRSWQAENHTLADIGIYSGASFNLSDADGAAYAVGGTVSWTMFRTLGVAPVLGRAFTEDEDRVGGPKVVIIGNRLWHDRFDGARDVIGRQLTLNGEPSTIVGVMPPGFEFPGRAVVWTPMQMDPLQGRGNHSLSVIGRLKPGSTIQQAESDLGAIAARLSEQYPNTNTGWTAELESLRDNLVGSLRPALLLMMASVAFVLLIACANVANLLLARAAARSREIAVRLAVGANAWRIMRQLLTESTVLAVAGATLGVVVAHGSLQWIRANVVGAPPWVHLEIDGQVLAFTLFVAVATGGLFGLVPALHAVRPDVNEALRDAGARGASGGRQSQRLRSGLVIGEVALSVVLLVGAALLIRSFLGLQRVKPGFDPGNLLTMHVTLRGPQYDSTYKRFAFLDRALGEIAARPGIVSAAIINNLPLQSNNNTFFNVEHQMVPVGQEPLLEVRYSSPRILETLRVPLRRGRTFTPQEWADTGAAGRVAVINEYMAQHFWGTDEAAIGRRFTFALENDPNPRWITVIGVAADTKVMRLAEPPKFQGYMPYRQGGWSNVAVLARTRGDPALATSAVLGALAAVDPLVPAYRIMTMDESMAQSYWQQALYGKAFGAFALIALVLASVGVYGVISYAVSQRTREIGVRVALGAQHADVLRLVVRHGALLGGIGLAIGLAASIGVTRFLRGMLYGVSPLDPLSFAIVATVLVVVALVASWVPARRAARLDPVEALRSE